MGFPEQSTRMSLIQPRDDWENSQKNDWEHFTLFNSRTNIKKCKVINLRLTCQPYMTK